MTFTIPTTPGSVIMFDSWIDSDMMTESFKMVLALVPGEYANGQFVDAGWHDAYTAEMAEAYDVEFILKNGWNHEIVFEAPEADYIPVEKVDVSEFDFGTIVEISVNEEEYETDRLTFSYVPAFFDVTTGEHADMAWVNSYGDVATPKQIAKDIIATIVVNK